MLRLKGALHARCAQKAISTTELEVIVCPTANLANREPTVLKRVQQIHHLAKNVFPVSTVIVLLLQQRPGVNRVALVLTVKRAEVMNVHSVAREKQGTSLELLLLLIAYYVNPDTTIANQVAVANHVPRASSAPNLVLH